MVCEAPLEGHLVRAGACGGFEYQRLSASGYGVNRPGSGSADWAAIAGALFVDFKVARWLWVVTRVEGTAPDRQPTFVLSNVGKVFEVGPIGRGLLGLETRL